MRGSYAARQSETMLESCCLLTAILAENHVSDTEPSSVYIQYIYVIYCRFEYKALRKNITFFRKAP